MWPVMGRPYSAPPPDSLHTIPTSEDVDFEGAGEILRVESHPTPGARKFEVDRDTGAITDETYTTIPTSYVIQSVGAVPGKVALTFDDGPDPEWTPAILDILKAKDVKATFFVIGENAEANPGLVARILAEGHELGNHTFTHPNLADTPNAGVATGTERDTTADRGDHRPFDAAVPAALYGRRRTGVGRRNRTGRDCAKPRLHHRRRTRRYGRLAIADAADDDRNVDGGNQESQSGIPRQHHPAARFRRRPFAHRGGAWPSDRPAACRTLPDRAGIRACRPHPRSGDAAAVSDRRTDDGPRGLPDIELARLGLLRVLHDRDCAWPHAASGAFTPGFLESPTDRTHHAADARSGLAPGFRPYSRLQRRSRDRHHRRAHPGERLSRTRGHRHRRRFARQHLRRSERTLRRRAARDT